MDDNLQQYVMQLKNKNTTVGTVPQYNRNIKEAKSIPLTQKYKLLLLLLVFSSYLRSTPNRIKFMYLKQITRQIWR